MSGRFPIHSWHAGFRMKLKNGKGGGVLVWQNRFLANGRLSWLSEKSWQSAILVIVVLLHGLLIGYGVSWRAAYRENVLIPDDALQITFIDRVSPMPPERQNVQKVDARKKALIRNRNANEISIDHPAADKVVNADFGNSLRLTPDKNEWETLPAIGPRSFLDRQTMALPGRAEPYVEGIRLSRQLTPEQRLAMVGRLLFGGVDYNPCKEARNRMANARSEADRLDVDADLRIIEKNCRP